MHASSSKWRPPMPDPESQPESAALPTIDEISLPLKEMEAPNPLALDTPLASPDGSIFHVLNLFGTEGNHRRYDGVRESDGKPVWIREAWTAEGVNSLAEEARVLEAVAAPMIPARLAWWEDSDKAYLVTESRPGLNLNEILKGQKLPLAQTLSVLAQVAHGISQFHRAGWVHLGLPTKVIIHGKPTSIVSFGDPVRVGEKPRRSFYY